MADVDQASLNAAFAANAAPQGEPDQDALNAAFTAQQATPAPSMQPRGALAEIGSGLARGALVDLPKMVGQAAQYAGIQSGAGMVASADQRGQQSWLTAQPDQHNAVTNALASGASMVGPMLAPIAATAAIAAAPVELPALAVGALGAGAGGLLFGAQAGQQTLEAGAKAGVTPESAQTAARLNFGTTLAAQVGMGMVGGRFLGVVGDTIGKYVGQEASAAAPGILSQLTGSAPLLSGFGKAVATTAAENVGLGAGQSALTAGINNEYGIDNTSPLTAAMQSIGPSLGMTAVMGPLALAGRALGARSAQTRTSVLAHPDAPPEVRTQLAEQYALAIGKAGTPEAQEAAYNFLDNAKTAINNKQPLTVDPGLFVADAVKGPQPEAAVPQLGAPAASVDQMVANSNGLVSKAGSTYTFPDGSSTDDIRQVQAYLDEQQRNAANPATAPQITNAPTPEALDQMVANSNGLVTKAGTEYTFPDGSKTTDLNQVQSFFDAQKAPAEPAAPALLPFNAPPEAIDQMVANSNGLIGKVGKEYTFPDGSKTTDINDVQDFMTRQAAEQNNQPEALQLLHNPTPPEIEQMVATSDGLVTKAGTSYTFPDGSSTTDLNQVRTFFAEKAASDAARAADPNSPKTSADIATDVLSANKTITGEDGIKPQQRVPLQKQLDAIKIDTLPDHQAQIDAIDARLADPDVTIGAATRERMQALSAKWKSDLEAANVKPETIPGLADETARPVDEAAQQVPAAEGIAGEPPAAAAALGENIPASVTDNAPASADVLGKNIPVPAPDNSPQPAAAAALGDNLTKTPLEHAADVADKVTAAIVGINDRVRRGETLTPLEQERLSNLKGFNVSLSHFQEYPNRYEDEHISLINQMAEDAASKPYKKSFDSLNHYKVATPEAVDPALMLDSLKTDKAQATLETIAKNSQDPDVRAYADKLSKLGLDTTLKYGTPTDSVTAGQYDPNTNHISIFPGGETEATILHEATHAATFAQIDKAENLGTPKNQADIKLKAAYNEIESIRNAAALRDTANQYGLTSAHEFIAELNANPAFRDFLKSEQANGKSLFARTIDGIKKLLGFGGAQGNFLERALGAQDAFFQKQVEKNSAGFPLPEGSVQYKLFNKSPKDATGVVDDTYSKMAGLGNKVGPINFKAVDRYAFNKLLGWKTVDYIADRVRALPEFVQSGLAKALDNHQLAHEVKRVATSAIEHPITKYAQRVSDIVNKAGGGDKSRDLSEQLATISGEASRGEFDYKMNFADNLKKRPDLPAANKAYIDDIHRQYQQLKATNPEAAKALVDGELLNRKLLINKSAIVTKNLMEAAAGNVSRLQGMLDRMAPNDPARADMQTRVNLANLESLMAAKHAANLDFMGAGVKAGKNTDPARFADGQDATLSKNMDAAFADARALPAGSQLRANMTALESMYRAQEKNPYFSLGRSGDYFVKVAFKNMDEATQAKLQAALKGTNKVMGNLLGGETHAFFRVDTPDQAAGLYGKLLQAGGDKIDGTGSAQGKLADNDSVNASGVPDAVRKLMASLHETVENSGLSGDAAASMRDTLSRQVLSMLPETSSRSATMQRRGIPGYDADFLGNYARRAQGGVQDVANMYTQRAFSDSLNGMKAAVQTLNRAGNLDIATRGQMVADEINKRYANSQKPMDNSTINTINSLGHTFYLAASPAYLIRTMAQPFHRAVPLLGSRYGMVNAATEIGRATGTAIKIAQQTIANGYKNGGGLRGVLDGNIDVKSLGLPANEQAFVKEMMDRGILNLGQSRQLQSMALGGTQRQQDLTRMAGMTAQYAEMTNRLATGLAAFRLAEKGSKNVTQEGQTANIEYALKTVNRAMDNFDQSNTARNIGKNAPITGKATPLFTAFMNYNLQTMQQIARTVHDGLFNQDPSAAGLQRSAEAKREFAGLMATTAMISGGLGLPFANAFAGVYNTLTNDNKDPKDIRVSAQNFLDNTLGHTAGGIVAHGIPHALGFDSSTFGLENLLPGSDFLASRALLKDRIGEQSQAMLGPALNAGIGVLQAADKFSDGHYIKGIEAALPSGLKPYYKAVELANKGYTDAKGNPLPMSAPTWGEIALQGVGFNSARRATQMEVASANAARGDRLALVRGEVTDKFYKGIVNQDPATQQSALADMQDFNAKNPTQPIRNLGNAMRARLTAQAVGGIAGAGVALGKRALPSFSQNFSFGRDPNEAMP